MSQEGDSSGALLPPAAAEAKSGENFAPGGAVRPEDTSSGAAAAALGGGAARPEDANIVLLV